MKTLAFLFTVLGAISLAGVDSGLNYPALKAESVATNYGIYRNAVSNYVTGTPGITSGEIPQSLLDLPSGWKALHSWANRLDGGNCYVWGPVENSEAREIRKLFMHSYAIGVKRDGALVNAHGTGITLPGFIPEGSIVSVIVQ